MLQSFSAALSCVLQMLLYMLPGYLVVKLKKLAPTGLAPLSSVLVYICSPCMVVASFLKLDYSPVLFGKLWLVFGLSLGLQLLFAGLLLFIFRKKLDEAATRVMCIASALGNVGFFGLPLLTAVLPGVPEAAAYSCIFCVTMDAVMFTLGLYCYTRSKKSISLRGFLVNPIVPSFLLGMLLYALQLKNYLPSLLTGALSMLGSMTTPISMLILGARAATCSLSGLFANGFAWKGTALKLVAFPLMCCALLWFMPLDPTLRFSLMLLAGAPCGSIVSSMAELHHTQESNTAAMLLLSTLLSLVTMPLLSMLCSLAL